MPTVGAQGSVLTVSAKLRVWTVDAEGHPTSPPCDVAGITVAPIDHDGLLPYIKLSVTDGVITMIADHDEPADVEPEAVEPAPLAYCRRR